jgi:ubiquinone/menaquinone biosynthesis C-methylase UbiE
VRRSKFVTASEETERERARRRHQRGLFDRVAPLYEQTRPGYPRSLVEWVAATAGVTAGDPVLEIGCGTGQLTGRLARLGLDLTAIDISPSMVAAAQASAGEPRAGERPARFWAGSFEELQAPDASVALIVSAAAFHWVDPEVRFRKAARLLRPGGWLAVLDHAERYDEPFGSVLRAMWQARNDGGGAWMTRQADSDAFAGSGLFEAAVREVVTWRAQRSADAVAGVEGTRAISLSWPPDVQAGFAAEIRHRLAGHDGVGVTIESQVTMARAAIG